MTLARRLTGELLGTALLLAAVVGSGIMGERLSGGNAAIALLANTLATGATLVTLIFSFGAVSGAHFNPAVTLADASQGGMRWRDVPGYIAVQAAGAMLGVWAAHLMFAEPVLQVSQHVRAGGSQLFSEFIATFGLLSVIWGCGRLRTEAVPFAVGLYITGAYWFTASTSFANPAVTLARAFTNTFPGIRPADAPGFMAAQLIVRSPRRCFSDGLCRPCPNRHGTLWCLTQRRNSRMADKKRVLILCTGNSARSQMAEGLLRHDAGDRFTVDSAGTKPSTVRPEAITAMQEIGIDITSHRSKHVDEFEGKDFDYVLTVCDNAKESCPVFFGKAVRLHQNFNDPAAVEGTDEKRLGVFRKVRDELRAYLSKFPQND